MRRHLILLPFLYFGITAKGQSADSAQHYIAIGKTEMFAKRYLVASRNFEKALSFEPNNTEALLNGSYTYLEMRKLNMALEGFKKVYALQPNNAEAIEQLTNLYYNFRQYEKAIEMAKKCNTCENTSRIIGMSHYRLENFPEAEAQLKAAPTENGDDAEVAYTLGRNFLDMSEYKKAIPYYEKAILIDPSKSLWMYELGLIYYNEYDYKNAVTLFDKAASAGYVQSNDFKENFGYAAMYAGQIDRGEELLNQVLSKKPGNTEILRGLAELMYKNKQYDRSLNYCRQLMEKNPKDGEALYQAGLNFIKKGEKDKGQQMCDKAIEMNPALANLRRKKEMVF